MHDKREKDIKRKMRRITIGLTVVALLLIIQLVTDGIGYGTASLQLDHARHPPRALISNAEIEAAEAVADSQCQEIRQRMLGQGIMLLIVLSCTWSTIRLVKFTETQEADAA